MSPFLSDNLNTFRGMFGRDITDRDIREEIARLRRLINERQRRRYAHCANCGNVRLIKARACRGCGAAVRNQVAP